MNSHGPTRYTCVITAKSPCDIPSSFWSTRPASGCQVTRLTSSSKAIASLFGRDPSPTHTHASAITSPHATHSFVCTPNSGCMPMVPSLHDHGSSSAYVTSSLLPLLAGQWRRNRVSRGRHCTPPHPDSRQLQHLQSLCAQEPFPL